MSTVELLQRIQADIRKQLKAHGTDVDLNDKDPTGDGDQSPIRLNHAGKQFYRDLFSKGGDIEECLYANQISQFAVACMTGNVAQVETALEDANGVTAPEPSKKLIRLLETRETSMRLSPLLFIVSVGKNIQPQTAELARRQLQVARTLLKYGARPDVKDVCGKTVAHYGAGMMATKMTMEIVTMCIEAAESSYLFGKEVELFGLKNKTMIGKRGIALGFDAETGRRAVYLFDDKKQIALKPEHTRLSNKEEAPSLPRLCDVQDRLGGVSLIEVVMGNRDDVATFLLDKHNARIDVADSDGVSPQSMATHPGAEMVSPVAKLIKQRVTKEGRTKTTERGQCSWCDTVETSDTPLSVCSRCKSAQYCSKDCQAKHWKQGGHKKACKKAAEEIVVLEKPEAHPDFPYTASFSFASRSLHSDGSYRKPDYVALGETFYVKVQCAGLNSPLLIYDKSRQCEFHYGSELRGYTELYKVVKAEKAFGGRKTYLLASFDESGNCSVYLGTATLKKW